MKDNPSKALEALTSTSRLTLGKIALLCRLESPILAGNVESLPDTLTAVYVIEQPLAESLVRLRTIEEEAIAFYDGLSAEEYRRKVAGALDAVASFFEMLPRPSPSSKKNSATDGSPNSRSGSAARTATGSGTCLKSSRPSRPRSSGAAGSRGRAEARPARS